MFRFVYMMNCKDANGVQRDFEHSAYFCGNTRGLALDLLSHWLRTWTGAACPNGGTYIYHITPDQALKNVHVEPTDDPEPFKSVWTGKCSHQHYLTESRVA
jgi:hypothetical protein